MQVALLVPENEWRTLLHTVSKLEEAHVAALGLTPEAVRRARREGRLKGIRRNEKEWGFYRSVIEQFPRRYHRQG